MANDFSTTKPPEYRFSAHSEKSKILRHHHLTACNRLLSLSYLEAENNEKHAKRLEVQRSNDVRSPKTPRTSVHQKQQIKQFAPPSKKFFLRAPSTKANVSGATCLLLHAWRAYKVDY